MDGFISMENNELVLSIQNDESRTGFSDLLGKYKYLIYKSVNYCFKDGHSIGNAQKVDAIAIGEAALFDAVLKYKPEEGPFACFAEKTIRGRVKNYINKNKSIIINYSTQRRINELKNVYKELEEGFSEEPLTKQNDKFPNDDTLIDALKKKYPKTPWDKCFVETKLAANSREVSIYQPIVDKEGHSCDLIDTIPAETSTPEDLSEIKEKQNKIKQIYITGTTKFINSTDMRDKTKYILIQYYTYDNDKSVIAKQLNNSTFAHRNSQFTLEIRG
jgi:DNA-directed RNA polymerase specialized sigma subunit